MDKQNKLINHFKVLGIREEKNLQTWFENQVGTRRAKIYTDKGFKSYVVSFENLGKWKTKKQIKAIYGLLSIFYKSGCYSNQNIECFEDLKAYYKKEMGLIDYYVFFDGEKIVKVKEEREIPNHIKKQSCRIILKSLSLLTKKQGIDGIGLLKTDMINSKIMQTSYGKEFEMILQIMENNF